MAIVKAESKRALWSYLQRNSTPDFISGLQQQQDKIVQAISTGKNLTASSGNGFSATFTIIGAMPPDEMLGLSQEMIEIYTDARNALIAAATIASNTPSNVADPLIRERGLLDDRMTAVTRYQTDYTSIRIPQTMGGPV